MSPRALLISAETKAWEVDTCRGHFQNASACLFHPHQDLILSVGEDKTVRVWDLNKRTLVQSFKRENDRFWVIAAHPEINLFAAGHDNGVMVFKLERERPASAVYQNQLVFITKEKAVRMYDFAKNVESPSMLSLKKLGQAWTPPRALSFNPAERAILVSSPSDGGVYELINLPRDASGAVEPTDSKRGTGNAAVWVARDRFAVFSQANQQVDIKNLQDAVTSSVRTPPGTVDIAYGGKGFLLLITGSSVVRHDVQNERKVAELSVSGVKYVVWSNSGEHVALLSKHNVTIASQSLEQISTLHETIRIKSACWDDGGVLLYSTLNHIKFSLMNGDNGIVRTLEHPVYLVRVKGHTVYCLDRAAKPRPIQFDPTEYRFKQALVKRDYPEVLNIIKTSSLVGQSIISYLQKKGYPEIALQFIQDPQTRFELSIECGNLEVATDMAKQLDKPKLWTRLGTEALAHGNHQIVEMCYQKLRNFDKLSFLYLCTGDQEKLARMTKIAEFRRDVTSRFQNTLYLRDAGNRINMYKDIDLCKGVTLYDYFESRTSLTWAVDPLAYMTAKANGMDDECKEILDSCGVTEDVITMPQLGSPLKKPQPIVPVYKHNWPTKVSDSSNFEKILKQQLEGGDEDEEAESGVGETNGDEVDGEDGEENLIDE